MNACPACAHRDRAAAGRPGHRRPGLVAARRGGGADRRGDICRRVRMGGIRATAVRAGSTRLCRCHPARADGRRDARERPALAEAHPARSRPSGGWSPSCGWRCGPRRVGSSRPPSLVSWCWCRPASACRTSSLLQPHGQLLLLFLIVLIAAADVGAYFGGRRFGRRKLAPHVSPGKTWEGFAAGMLAAATVALACSFLFAKPFWPWLFLVRARRAGVGRRRPDRKHVQASCRPEGQWQAAARSRRHPRSHRQPHRGRADVPARAARAGTGPMKRVAVLGSTGSIGSQHARRAGTTPRSLRGRRPGGGVELGAAAGAVRAVSSGRSRAAGSGVRGTARARTACSPVPHGSGLRTRCAERRLPPVPRWTS